MYSILIIDDNALTLKLEKIFLISEGFDVHCATGAEEALILLKELKPAIILVDLQLPGMSGLELVNLLRTDPRYKKIPIIAVTAYAMKEDKEKAKAAGCDDYITKPIDTNNFLVVINKHLKSTE